MADASDLELLKLEMQTLWGEDAFGRALRPHPFVAIAVADDGRAVSFDPSLPAELRSLGIEKELLSLPPGDESTYSDRFAQYGPTILRGCLSYGFDGTSLFPESHTDLTVLTSESGERAKFKAARTESWGDADEWACLLAGQFGPWAMGVVDDRVVSICYTPAASTVAAEAGLWTIPEIRGRGYGGIVASAWSQAAASHFETLFYSTSFENLASQAVAMKLNLRPIGCIWQLHLET